MLGPNPTVFQWINDMHCLNEDFACYITVDNLVDGVEKNVTYGICSKEDSPGSFKMETGEFKKYGINPAKVTGWRCNKGVMGVIYDVSGMQPVESLMPGTETTY